ncbi:FAD-dependent monooxygenase [Streptomyces olivaceus]|uniref:Flavin-dependent monooxygenase n=1 Tax=Streptomyces olivaceus TaxID=47716 RepID=A0ABS7VZQ0_STROV|nr:MULTISPECIES: NAD(P)/FAD-dependent oxidoreductase [Streptomyces]MBZ6088343.1 FAD-dependent monooxygenase [Streptomyces olivaceus]MBZ6094821.1 FAD-dependent monooxygenase [Streptomyces olivaceus]MBZ6116482.1 FAD-dependent monooxygenase [Streptomyces olivaceus]MBZ6151187.1 FAD-dependent monooxygenase [Streptomyces olivaceus]MBZ6191437.1 FAD-dependent monooxygenase [Streptomyces olivaceus]
MNSPTPANARISIIGAGPGGLTCARVLRQHGIAATVYDREPDAASRDQGGSLDLHEEDGQLALREAGLLAEFFALARTESQEERRIDPAGRLLGHRLPDEGETTRPEIDRGQLRDVLLRSLDEGAVRWGRTLASVGGPAEGPRTLTFTDGSTVETDLVIGADGAFSRVRAAVSAAVPRYTGVGFLEAWFDDVEVAHPELSALVGKGSAHVSDGERGLFAQRGSGGHLRVYLMRRVPADWLAEGGLRPDDTDRIRARLLGEYAGWAPELLRMITDNDGPYVDRPLFALPVPHTWPHAPGLTLLGDAAHLMPPLGAGVNLAMLDAAELALALAGSATVEDAVRGYEEVMLPRSAEIAGMLDGGAGFLLEVPDADELARYGRSDAGLAV